MYLLASLLKASPELLTRSEDPHQRDEDGGGASGRSAAGSRAAAAAAEGDDSLQRAAQLGEPRALFEWAQVLWDRGDVEGALAGLHGAAAKRHVRAAPGAAGGPPHFLNISFTRSASD